MDRSPHSANKVTLMMGQQRCLVLSAHLVDVYVVVVRRVVDGFEEALELAGGSPVDGEDECDADRL